MGFLAARNIVISERARFLIASGVLVLLQVVDGMVTTASIGTGLLREGNLVMAGVASADWFWLAKLLITVGVVVYLYIRIKGDEAQYRRVTKVLTVAGIVYVGIVLWNTYWLYAATRGIVT